ncbi:MAG: hypothetical protein H6R14_779 [Proteobacteria bacterium]|nr:hypothetical protein [Pseudomonadota bacterium]
MHKRLLQLLRDNAQRQPAGVRAESTGAGQTTLYLYDIIDSYWGVNAAELVKQIAQLNGQEINLRINSPGGDVFDGRSIAAAVQQHGNVTVWIDGLCASAATTVAIAAKTVNIANGAMFMIHNAWTLVYGNKEDLAETITLLDKIDQAIAIDYVNKTGQSNDQVVEWMNSETWFTAQEAKDWGFVDAIFGADGTKNNAARWNLSAYQNAPKIEPEEPPAPDPSILKENAARRLRLLLPNY